MAKAWSFGHKEFEKFVKRVFSLLEGEGATVEWNEHVPDPLAPDLSRQIDVSIRRDGRLTLVECRDHKVPQDVMWIEELIGRRLSLEAHGVIAVSTSGFTELALRKAEAFGIFAYDLRKVTDEEIVSWGATAGAQFTFLQFERFSIEAKGTSQILENTHRVHLTLEDGGDPMLFLLDKIKRMVLLGTKGHIMEPGVYGESEITFIPDGVLANGYPVEELKIEFRCRFVKSMIELPICLSFGYSTEKKASHAFPVMVRQSVESRSELIAAKNGAAIRVDASRLQPLRNSIVAGVTFELGERQSRLVNAEIINPRNMLKYSLDDYEFNMVVSS